MTDKTCKTCRHWKPIRGGIAMGQCGKPGQTDQGPDAAWGYNYSTEEPTPIYCGPEYYCPHHEPKQDGE